MQVKQSITSKAKCLVRIHKIDEANELLSTYVDDLQKSNIVMFKAVKLWAAIGNQETLLKALMYINQYNINIGSF